MNYDTVTLLHLSARETAITSKPTIYISDLTGVTMHIFRSFTALEQELSDIESTFYQKFHEYTRDINALVLRNIKGDKYLPPYIEFGTESDNIHYVIFIPQQRVDWMLLKQF